MSMKPTTQGNGSLSSQDNGAQELKGGYTTRPFQPQAGKNASFSTNPLMGTKGGADMLGTLNGRKTK